MVIRELCGSFYELNVFTNRLKYEDKTSYLHALVILFFKTLYIKFVCTNKEIVSKNRF